MIKREREKTKKRGELVQLDFEGNVALVTGAGSGVGRTTAKLLAMAGAKVVLNDIKKEGIEELKQELSKQGISALCVVADITVEAEVLQMVRQVEQEFGAVTILVNNAGLWVQKPFLSTTRADWNREIDLNVFGVLHCVQAVLPAMVEAKKGRIITVTSEAARIGEPNTAVYSAAKAAVVGFTKALAKEVGRAGVTVNCVALAMTETPQTASVFADPEILKRALKFYPLGRFGKPDDAAAAILFLASKEASWITGQTLGVNGGYAMF